MTPEQFKKLKRGDLIRHKNSANAYVVDGHYGTMGIIAVDTTLMTQPHEWDKVTEGGSIIHETDDYSSDLPFFGFRKTEVRDASDPKHEVWDRHMWFAIYEDLNFVLIEKDFNDRSTNKDDHEKVSTMSRKLASDEVSFWLNNVKITEEAFYTARNSAFPWQ